MTSKVTRVTVDRTLCFSHERCIRTAPDVFSIDDEGISIVGDIHNADDDTLLAAAFACPVQAIFVFDADDNQLYPEELAW
jgi:ferredoxin